MDREYIAFISYRHLDTPIAKRVHKTLEHYIIPRKLRDSTGTKKLGYVFRDSDELPLSSNLSDNISMALSRSKYLIVICSKNTPHSKWVNEEVSMFLKMNNGDHTKIFTILVDGTPEESFPPQLLHDNGVDYEPLGANLTEGGPFSKSVQYHRETLRLISMLIGCSFDDLYQRELRYKRRRSLAVFSLFAAIAVAFIGLLLNRNAAITRQFRQSQLNESRAASLLSQNAFREGDRYTALEYAISALPYEDKDRPFYPEAEYALTNALKQYAPGELNYTCSIETPGIIQSIEISPNEQYAVCTYTDREYNLYLAAYDTISGAQLISYTDITVQDYYYSQDSEKLFIFCTDGFLRVYSLPDGTYSGEFQLSDDSLPISAIGPSPNSTLFAYIEKAEFGQDISNLCLLDIATGAVVSSFPCFKGFSSYTSYRGVFSHNGKYLAVLANSSDMDESLVLIDLPHKTIIEKSTDHSSVMYETVSEILFTSDDKLIVGFFEDYNIASLCCYDPRLSTLWETSEVYSVPTLYSDSTIIMVNPRLLYDSGYLYYANGYSLKIYNASRGTLENELQLPGQVADMFSYGNNSIGVITYDGIGTIVLPSVVGYDLGISNFDTGKKLVGASLSGDYFINSTFVLVPSEDRSRILVVSDILPIAADDFTWDEPGNFVPYEPIGPCDNSVPELLADDPLLEHTVFTESFAEQDTFIAITEHGFIHVYRLSTGLLLNSIDFSDYGVSYYTSSMEFRIYDQPEPGRVLMSCDVTQNVYSQSIGFSFETETGQCTALILGLMDYDKDSDLLLVTSSMGKLYTCPYLDLNEKMELAVKLLTER